MKAKFLTHILYSTPVILLALVTANVLAQNTSQMVFYSPEGNYLFLANNDNQKTLQADRDYIVLRRKKGEKQFSKTGAFSPVKKFDTFRKIAGEETALDFKKFIKAKTDDDVVSYINSKKMPSDFGIFLFDVNFLQAAGLGYLDPLPAADRMQYEYRVTATSGNVLYEQSPKAFDAGEIPTLMVSKIFNTDSMVSIRWQSAQKQPALPLFAKIYRQMDGKGKFVLLPKIRMVMQDEDKNSFLRFDEQVLPERLINYYIVPVDMVGNEGPNSDTAGVITVSQRNLVGVRNLKISDSMGGLFSQWSPLDLKPYFTGIQVERSRNPKEKYTVIDTLSATATTYLDKGVLPNVTYHYKFTVLLYKLSSLGEMLGATIHGSTKASNRIPLPPKNLRAENKKEDIRLVWDIGLDLDHHTYYVQRGTSSGNMVIVSQAVYDSTWTDTSAVLSGRTNYVYSVIAMNSSQLRSAPSNAIAIRPDRRGFIESPAGLSANVQGQHVVLSWIDISKNDAAIEGYFIYRRKKAEKDFSALNTALFKGNYYEDATVAEGESYEYAITAIDMYGYQSKPSPFANADMNTSKPMPPTAPGVRRLKTGVEISWAQNNHSQIVSYKIYRKSADSKKYTMIGTVKKSAGLYLDKTPLAGKLNVYAISIVTNQGETNVSGANSIFITR